MDREIKKRSRLRGAAKREILTDELNIAGSPARENTDGHNFSDEDIVIPKNLHSALNTPKLLKEDFANDRKETKNRRKSLRNSTRVQKVNYTGHSDVDERSDEEDDKYARTGANDAFSENEEDNDFEFKRVGNTNNVRKRRKSSVASANQLRDETAQNNYEPILLASHQDRTNNETKKTSKSRKKTPTQLTQQPVTPQFKASKSSKVSKPKNLQLIPTTTKVRTKTRPPSNISNPAASLIPHKQKQKLKQKQTSNEQHSQQHHFQRDLKTITTTTFLSSLDRSKSNSSSIEIQVNRLINNLSNKPPIKINTLDVISTILKEFIMVYIKKIDDKDRVHDLESGTVELISNYFRNVENHLRIVLDLNLCIENLNKSLYQLNREKNNIRGEFYQVRENHREVGVKLEKLRDNFKEKKKQFEKDSTIDRNLGQLILNEANGKSRTNDVCINKMPNMVDLSLFKLNSIANSSYGLIEKLKNFNQSLQNLDERLNTDVVN